MSARVLKLHAMARTVLPALAAGALTWHTALAAGQAGIPGNGGPTQPIIPPGKVGPGAQRGLAEDTAAIQASASDVLTRPNDYLNRNVSVTGIMEAVFTPWSFKLQGENKSPRLMSNVGEGLLVIGAEPLVTYGYEPGWVHKNVKVTGTVRILQSEDVKRRPYGHGVDDKLFRRFVGKPVLVAASIGKAE